ncbi:DNA/RNA helicase domain-containing protein [Arthrobacter sp. Leaf337]|uniref:DNA/RNA helicase domain-containing protein n=1 Tax=Arthrobacter sp. Leaf337 TaxID=1736342 RepID=UPI001F3488D5|nr:DNA/RNA helicase domain-containing protein [Arthrobacter sp. Leaf337]
MRQHLKSPEKSGLHRMHLVIDDTFHKSACLDLESFLIRLFAGEGRYQVLNGNAGISDSDYYDRDKYTSSFNQIFDELRAEGMFERSIPEIENSDLFKFSPFKALNHDQAGAVGDILDGLLDDVERREPSTSVIQGDPGTGKTIIAVYLMKLLRDIQLSQEGENFDSDSIFADYFVEGNRDLIADLKIGLVVPQQSLRSTIKKVFNKTPSLQPDMVLSPFDLSPSEDPYDLLIVDEAHRLSQRANQPSGPQNKKYREITEALFGIDDLSITQLDWVRESSKHQILLVDAEQSVRPADLPRELVHSLILTSQAEKKYYRLHSQMRVQGGTDYIKYIRGILSSKPPVQAPVDNYDFRFFDNVRDMHDAIRRRESEVQLARLVAGFAWPWRTKTDPNAFDIEIDGYRLRWNKTQTDWINSTNSVEEVGSIHTVQGYDLNYAGVIIGPDLRFDPGTQSIVVNRVGYHDKKGKENNPKLGLVYTDNDLLRYITNIYAVLMTRGMNGTYVYVHDKELREYLRKFIPRGDGS